MNLTQEETDKIFNIITSNGCREMNEVRFNQAINEAIAESNRLEKLVSLQNAYKAMQAKLVAYKNGNMEFEDLEDDLHLLLMNSYCLLKNEYEVKYRELLTILKGWRKTLDKNSELYESLNHLESILPN